MDLIISHGYYSNLLRCIEEGIFTILEVVYAMVQHARFRPVPGNRLRAMNSHNRQSESKTCHLSVLVGSGESEVATDFLFVGPDDGESSSIYFQNDTRDSGRHRFCVVNAYLSSFCKIRSTLFAVLQLTTYQHRTSESTRHLCVLEILKALFQRDEMAIRESPHVV